MRNSVNKRYVALDGLRGVAAIIVVLHHVHFTMRGDPMFVFGPLAVDFFFILSGFVIAHAYGDRLRSGTTSLGGYAARRVIRLYPMIVLGALWGLSYHLLSGRSELGLNAVWYLASSLICFPFTFLEYGSRDFLNPPAWSLFFEIVASLVFGIAAFRLRSIHLLFTVLVFAALVIWGELHFHTNQLGTTEESFGLGFARIGFSFGAGILIQRLQRSFAFPFAIPVWILAAGMIVIMGMPYLNRGEMPLNLGSVLLVFPVMIFVGAESPEGGVISRQVLSFLGDISYPLYILHWPLFWWIKAVVLPHLPTMDIRIYGVASTLLAIAIAYAILRLFDEPVRAALTKLFLASRARQSPA